MSSQTWIIEYLKMYKISDKIINFITKVMESWRVKLIVRTQTLEEVKIQRGLFLGDLLLQLLFVICNDATQLHTQYTGDYKFFESQEKINHLMYMATSRNLQKMKKNWNQRWKQ